MQQYANASSSDIKSGSEIDLYGILQPDNEAQIWVSQSGLAQAFYQMTFNQEYLIKRLIIEWVYAPKKFSVEFMDSEGNWSE